jgi:hypothetical protein
MITSSGPIWIRVSTVVRALDSRLWWVSSAPFGRPVVPDVKDHCGVVGGALRRLRDRFAGLLVDGAPRSSTTSAGTPAAAAAAITSLAPSPQNTTEQPESVRWYSSSRGLNSGFNGTTTAPASSEP